MDFLKNISVLAQFLSPKRIKKFSSNLRNRTDFLTVVIDDIYQSQNASAVIRSCDAFGLSDIYVIEDKNKFVPVKGISQGVEKWLNIKKFSDRQKCYDELLNEGYEICVAVPPCEKTVYIDEFEPEGKIAVVVGAEMSGVSDFFMQKADRFISIKMYGFVESFNLSVASSIILYELRKKIEKSDFDWRLSPIKKAKVFYRWMKKSVYFADKIISGDIEN